MSTEPNLEKLVYEATVQHDQLAAKLLEFARKRMTDDDRRELLEVAQVYRIAAEGIFTCAQIIAKTGTG